MIEGLSHLTLIFSDLDRMSRLLGTAFNAREVYSSGDQTVSLSREKLFLIGDIWIAVMDGRPPPTRTYSHTAFKIGEADLPLYRERLSSLGLDLRESRPRVSGEGFSLYFYDHDNHLFELHTGTLSDRLARYADRHEAAA